MDTHAPATAVLLVDDDESLLRSICLLLRRAGIGPIASESDPRRVMDDLAHQPTALVILDIAMPHLSGQSLLPRIRATYPQVQVIMLSASDDPDTIIWCHQQGAMDYLVKPVAREQLIAAVRGALASASRQASV